MNARDSFVYRLLAKSLVREGGTLLVSEVLSFPLVSEVCEKKSYSAC